jgi:hypothetical protein
VRPTPRARAGESEQTQDDPRDRHRFGHDQPGDPESRQYVGVRFGVVVERAGDHVADGQVDGLPHPQIR